MSTNLEHDPLFARPRQKHSALTLIASKSDDILADKASYDDDDFLKQTEAVRDSERRIDVVRQTNRVWRADGVRRKNLSVVRQWFSISRH